MKLTKREKQKINKVGRKYNLKLILLHGSYVQVKLNQEVIWILLFSVKIQLILKHYPGSI